mgnify:CR=1 FL=1
MIIECQNCNKKFDLEDKLIPLKGRLVQCGFCHSQWHQLPNIITSSLKKKVIDKVDISKDEVKELSINKKKKIKNKARDNQKFKNKNIGFFSYIFIFLISVIAFFLIAETFEYQINNIFPNFGNYIIYVYETLNNILILIKDLFKSY